MKTKISILLILTFSYYELRCQINYFRPNETFSYSINPHLIFNFQTKEPGLGLFLSRNYKKVNYFLNFNYFTGLNNYKEIFVGPGLELKIINPYKKLTNFVKYPKEKSFKLSLIASIEKNFWFSNDLKDTNPFLGLIIRKKVKSLSFFLSVEKDFSYNETRIKNGISLNLIKNKYYTNECK